MLFSVSVVTREALAAAARPAVVAATCAVLLLGFGVEPASAQPFGSAGAAQASGVEAPSAIRTGAPITPRAIAFEMRYGSSPGATARAPSYVLPKDRWWAMDKAKHVGGSMLWTLSTQYVLVAKAGWSEGDALPVSVASAATIGLAKEVYDRHLGPTRYFSGKDLVADGVGILLGVGVVLL